MTDGLTVLAVDDERTQLDDLARLLRRSALVEDVECAYDGREALLKASAARFDVIFLDVRMPELDGVALARVLRRFDEAPRLVFVSAHDDAAVDAFELEAVDYLRKPVSRQRLDQALARVAAATGDAAVPGPRGGARDRAAHSPGADGELPELLAVATAKGGTRLLQRDDILYAEAQGDYVRIVTADSRYLLRATVADLERRWSAAGFARVHRSLLANLHQAAEIRPRLGGTAELVFGDGRAIPIARRHVTELRRRLGV